MVYQKQLCLIETIHLQAHFGPIYNMDYFGYEFRLLSTSDGEVEALNKCL